MTATPDDITAHLRESLKEGLLAWRGLVDTMIAAIEEREQAAQAVPDEEAAERASAPVPEDEAEGMANP